MAVVLGFSGRKKSGKTTLTSTVAAELGWRLCSFGTVVRDEASARSLDATSVDVLQEVGESMIRNDIRAFCRRVLASAAWTPGESLLIDGIRHVEVLNCLRDLVVPTPLRLVYVETEIEVLESRYGQDAEHIASVERHSTEVQVVTTLPASADLTVSGSDSVEVATSRVVEFVRTQRGGD